MRTIKIGLLLAILAVIAVTPTMLYSQDSNKQTSLKQQTVDEAEVPTADYNASLPEVVGEKVKREKRNNNRNIKSSEQIDARKFMITENRESSYGGFSSHAPVEPAIPAAQSNVVIIGEVTDASAYLSEDKVSIYSEFTVNVNEILKNSTSEEINTGNSIVISRGGGAVRFASGKIIKNLFDGKPMPQTGRRYLFFLKYNNQAQDYPIITAYELRNAKVVPLDGLERDGRIAHQLTPHQSYKGMSEEDFLNQVRQAIGNSIDVFEKREEL